MRDPNRFWNPYVAGVALGLVLLGSFVGMGRGLGASGASFRTGVALLQAVAPAHVAATPTLASATRDGHPLDDWLVFEVLGVLLGGAVGAYSSGRLSAEVLRGPRITPWTRVGLALAGGVLMGVAARMARGCTSGQALSGGALMSVGSWVFMLSVFAGGYALARVVRRAWR
ncbi:MAG TPA: YeeE/YedE thiosulfate transporter family protein [Aggregicoccus sp.]|nr:YeeE/YedE thiosulfate transporter family protein [Aggregicoccus sp.]